MSATAVAFALYARVAWPWLVLGWVGLVPWLTVLDRARTWRGTLAASLLLCELFVAAVFAWFVPAIASYTGMLRPVALVVILVLAPLLEPQFVAYALVRRLAVRHGMGWSTAAVAAAGMYVGVEWVWPKVFADTLGQGLYASALLRQAADLGGTAGLTFVVLLSNECGAAMLRAAAAARGRQALLAPAAAVATMLAALLLYGGLRIRQVDNEPALEPVVAGIVQSNLSRYNRLRAEMGAFDTVRLILDTHFSLSGQVLGGAPLDVLIWPETVYPTTFGTPKNELGADFDREIAGFVQQTQTPLIFGAYDVEGGHEFNAAVFLEPSDDGRVAFDTYRKAALFPFTERVPALLDSPGLRRRFPWLGTWTPGPGGEVVDLMLRGGRTLRVAPLICYDAIDPRLAIAAVRRGAELIVTLSNDSWFAHGQGPHLHLVLSAFRSIETRRPQFRATTTGMSAVITATGELTETLDVDRRATVRGVAAPRHAPWTLMLAWGDWFGPTGLVASLVALAFAAARCR